MDLQTRTLLVRVIYTMSLVFAGNVQRVSTYTLQKIEAKGGDDVILSSPAHPENSSFYTCTWSIKTADGKGQFFGALKSQEVKAFVKERFEITMDNVTGQCNMTIFAAQSIDSKTYYCEIMNEDGHELSQFEYQLVVQDRPADFWIEYNNKENYKKNGIVHIESKDIGIELQCVAGPSATAALLEWQFDTQLTPPITLLEQKNDTKVEDSENLHIAVRKVQRFTLGKHHRVTSTCIALHPGYDGGSKFITLVITTNETGTSRIPKSIGKSGSVYTNPFVSTIVLALVLRCVLLFLE